MKNFAPTWLYIKQHNVTGLYYFGKHTGKNPHKYKGSGQYWNNHLKVHGNDVTTKWSELFTDAESLVEFALFFSKEFDIVESKDSKKNKIWANLILENGIDGVVSGNIPWNKGKIGIVKDSAETKAKKSAALVGLIRGPQTAEHKAKHSAALRGIPGKPQTLATRLKRAKSKTGVAHKSHRPHGAQVKVTCPHCSKEGGNSVMQRHHFNRCKIKGNTNE